MSDRPKVTYGFVSFTEVDAGEHQSYNEWHLFDHMPEQLPLRGIVWGQRWVLSPELRASCRADAPLDRVHYVTLYLLADPITETVAEFFALARELRAKDRFHEHRTAHLSGPLVVVERLSAPRALVSPDAVPFRPNRGVHVRLGGRDDAWARAAIEVPGVAGAWTFSADDNSPPGLAGSHATWCWLDEPPALVAPRLSGLSESAELRFTATLAAVDPWGPWDWFDS